MRENAPPPEPEGFEHLATIKDVRAYLEQKFSGDPKKANICQYPFGCDIDVLEPILLEDLVNAKLTDPDHGQWSRLRSLIRAASYLTHSRPETAKLIPLAESFVQEAEAHQKQLARTEPEEAKDWEEIRTMALAMVRALVQGLKAEDAEPAARAAEHFLHLAYREKQNTQRLRSLRELRDQIYFQRLYPTWFEAGTERLKKRNARPRS